MIPRPLRPWFFAAGVAAVAALPLLGRALRAGGGERCALDGIPVPAATRALVVEPGGEERVFCCVDCVVRWLERSGVEPEGVMLTDEATKRALPASEAWLVESRVASNVPAGCFVHVFADGEEARRHAEAFGGRLLEDHPLGTRGARGAGGGEEER